MLIRVNSSFDKFFRQKLKRLQLEQQVRDLEERLRKHTLAQVIHTESAGDGSTTQLEKEVSCLLDIE